MNNNFYDIPVDWYKEFNNTFNPNDNYLTNISNNNIFNGSNLANPKTALDRGNLFNNLYDPYRNYRYRELKAMNKKEELLYNLLKYKFVTNEIALYLDVHPNDVEMIKLYNNYIQEEKKACNEYEKNFGPITLDSNYLNGNSWNWTMNNWPWEGTR